MLSKIPKTAPILLLKYSKNTQYLPFLFTSPSTSFTLQVAKVLSKFEHFSFFTQQDKPGKKPSLCMYGKSLSKYAFIRSVDRGVVCWDRLPMYLVAMLSLVEERYFCVEQIGYWYTRGNYTYYLSPSMKIVTLWAWIVVSTTYVHTYIADFCR